MPRPKTTILVADDEQMVLKFVDLVLTRAGYRVLAALEANEAIRLCKDGAEPVELALLDVVMPGIDGPQLCNRLREIYPRLRVLFVSGYDDPEVRRRCGDHPTLEVLEKPFDSDQLLRRVRDLLERSQTQIA
ncbi:MAG TPA: response regulator [Candidatus Acidoferrum sp.]|nr:response regulator [Candidatus Acidoferrum sp.]